MQRIVLPTVIVLFLWCIGLTATQFYNPQRELSAELQSGKAPVVAYVHGDSIQSGYAFIEVQEEKLFVAVQQAQLAIDRASTPFRDEAQELIDYANSGAATPEDVQIAQQRLMELESQMGKIQEASQNELLELESSLQAEIASNLSRDVAEYAQERGLDVVLNWGLSGEGVLYGSAGLDVTAGLLEFMNDRFESEISSEEE
ncbi:MAG: OmpH family outer membrane protein [Flavobacteriales bacterium]|nr:OmpH family outer membrane protein [Flavobacteriales bacterium]